MMTMRRMSLNPFAMPAQQAIDDLLNSVFERPSRTNAESRPDADIFVPAVNVWEDENAVHIECELPGFEIGDIEITAIKNRLSLSGKRTLGVTNGESQLKVLFRERAGERFSRSIDLPVQVDFDQAQAQLQHGVLHVMLPKAQQARPRRIEVRSA